LVESLVFQLEVQEHTKKTQALGGWDCGAEHFRVVGLGFVCEFLARIPLEVGFPRVDFHIVVLHPVLNGGDI